MRSRELIVDVGMHDGRDTAFYLAKGFDVVAIEANPDLVVAARERFASEIGSGRLRVLHVAVAPREGTVDLAVADDASIWSSLSPDFIARNETWAHTDYRHVEVPARRFEDILGEIGMPYYLKIDIEGLDMLCVRALHAFDGRPAYISLESAVTSCRAPLEDVFDELAELWTLGYRSFKYVDQLTHPQVDLPSPSLEGEYVDWHFHVDDSGPFGEETVGDWHSIGAAFARGTQLELHHSIGGFGGRWHGTRAHRAYVALRRSVLHRPLGWYDLHARLPPPDAPPAPRRTNRNTPALV